MRSEKVNYSFEQSLLQADVGANREKLNQFITAVNSFHPALKYIGEISDTSSAFLDIKVSVEGNGICTRFH